MIRLPTGIAYLLPSCSSMRETLETQNEVLREALERQRIRFFVASGGSAKGKSGPEDTEKFGDNLMVMQECALLLGEKLGMHAVSSVVCYEKGETSGFCFDQNSDPQNPQVAGGIVNRRMPFREFLGAIREFINQ